MSLRVTTVRGLLWSGLERAGGQTLSVLTIVVLSRLLHPSDFGLMALANAYLMLGYLLFEDTINQVIVRDLAVPDELMDSAFSLSLALGVGLAALTVVLARPIAALFGQPGLAAMLRWLSLNLVLAALRSTQTALLQRELRFRELAVRAGVGEFVGGVIGVGMALAGAGVWSLVGQSIVRQAAATAVLWRVSDWRPGLRASRAQLQHLIRFGGPLVGDRFVNFLRGKADDLTIGFFLGTTALGYYAVGYRVLTFLSQLLAGTLSTVSLPVLSRLQEEPRRLRQAFLDIQGYIALGAFPVFVGMAATAAWVVPLAFGPRWQPSVPVMEILGLAGAGRAVVVVAGTLLVALGRPAVQFRVNAALTLAAVAGFLLAVPQGIVAVASIHLWVNLAAIPILGVVFRRVAELDPRGYYRSLVPAAIGVGAMSLALAAVQLAFPLGDPTVPGLVLRVGVGAATYLAASYAWDRQVYHRAWNSLRESLRFGLVPLPPMEPEDTVL